MKVQKIEDIYFAVTDHFVSTMRDVHTELDYQDTFQLLVAVMLSAQCTDKRVNMVTPAIFESYPTAEAMAAAGVEDVFLLIRSISYPNSKAAHLVSMARSLVERHGGEVPCDREQLQALAGVGRKTASVVRSVAFGMPEIAVDTHVFRVSARIGLTVGARTPLAAERQLVEGFSMVEKSGRFAKVQNLLGTAHHWLILHGRYTCTARKPKCGKCGLSNVCHYFCHHQL